MTEKNTKTQGLKTDPKRQASDSLRGYRYQILHSVDAWLDLADNETLYLEGAEDFDIASDDTATAVQVKDTQHKKEPKTGKNPIAQRLIDVMEKPPHLTHEDVEALRQSIEEGKIPIKFDSPFDPDERENQ